MKKLTTIVFILWTAFAVMGIKATVESDAKVLKEKCELVKLTKEEIAYYESKPEIFGQGMKYKKVCGKELLTIKN